MRNLVWYLTTLQSVDKFEWNCCYFVCHVSQLILCDLKLWFDSLSMLFICSIFMILLFYSISDSDENSKEAVLTPEPVRNFRDPSCNDTTVAARVLIVCYWKCRLREFQPRAAPSSRIIRRANRATGASMYMMCVTCTAFIFLIPRCGK